MTVFGIEIEDILLSPLHKYDGIYSILFPKENCSIVSLQSLNGVHAKSQQSIAFHTTEGTLIHPEKASFPIVFTDLPIITSLKLV